MPDLRYGKQQGKGNAVVSIDKIKPPIPSPRSMHTTPASLLERLRHPAQPEAWARFVELYTPLLYHWARRTGLQDQDAADLVQEVLLVLVKKLPEFRYDNSKSFRAWLRTVMVNKWREGQRRRSVPVDQAARLADLPDPQNDGAEALGEDEYRRHLTTRALQVMRPEFQPTTWRAFWEVAVAGRPAAEVAAELGLSINAVRAAKFRVLWRLRQELRGLLD
jgi:RNA polymerase sigma-70 factor (ECF subfamily)